MAEPRPLAFRLPFDLVEERFEHDLPLDGSAATVHIPDTYAAEMAGDIARSEVLAIQRLLTLSRRAPVHVVWGAQIAARAQASPSLFPLLAVVITLEDVEHTVAGLDREQADALLETARRNLFKQRLKTDMFSDTQVVICADSRGRGTPPDLYGNGGRMVARDDFEAIIEELVALQAGAEVSTSKAVQWSSALATIMSELFENADTHGKTELSGLPIKKNGIRGLVLKRIKLDRPANKATGKAADKVDAFELSEAHRESRRRFCWSYAAIGIPAICS